MSNVKNMTSKILKDAEAGKENILAAAEEEKNKIITVVHTICCRIRNQCFSEGKYARFCTDETSAGSMG